MALFDQPELALDGNKPDAVDKGQESNTSELQTDTVTSTSQLITTEAPAFQSAQDTAVNKSCHLKGNVNIGSSDNIKNGQHEPRGTIKQEEAYIFTKPVTSLYESSPECGLQISPSTPDNSDSPDSGRFSHSPSKEQCVLAARDINQYLISNCQTRTHQHQQAKGVKAFTISQLLGESTQSHGAGHTVCRADKDTAGISANKSGHASPIRPREVSKEKPCGQSTQQVSSRERKRRRSTSSDRCIDSSVVRSSSCDIDDHESASSSSSTGCTDAISTEGEGQGHTRPRRKLKRTQYSKSDLRILNAYFAEDNWLSPIKQEALAKEMGYSDVQIKTWFQNKRASIYGTRQPKGKNKERPTSSPRLDDSHNQRLSDQPLSDCKPGCLIPSINHENPFPPQAHRPAFSPHMLLATPWNPPAISQYPTASNSPDTGLTWQSPWNPELRPTVGFPSTGDSWTCAPSVIGDRYGSACQRIDYTLPENNPFIAGFLNLRDCYWNSARFSPLIKPHSTPPKLPWLALPLDERGRLA
ncbi:hypothetical protein EGW08_003768 [Elysia chlorotica]|uniref:Homeobox domain-containing protein n=1 Tax=Elysia chlorotica TaxID=188477 RepID=A0A433U401_ELYCH|nr:hypothetical protein EGW08_003768 [Elysia chlorotica]